MLFKPHTDIMGLAIIGKRLYMTSFTGMGGKGPGGEVFSMPLSGGSLTPVVTGFVAPVVGLAARGNTLYVGELTGQVFSDALTSRVPGGDVIEVFTFGLELGLLGSEMTPVTD